VLDDEEREDGPEEGVEGLDEVAGSDVLGVVGEERLPVLRRLLRLPDSAHVALDRALADLDAELEEPASDALRTPRVLPRNLLDEVDGLLGDPRLWAAGSGLPAPDEIEEVSVPAEPSVGLDEMEGASPRPPPARA
jgi:hypothetical protein